MDDPTVLIVDDDPDALRTAAMVVSFLGYQVRTADRPETALALIEEIASFRVLLTDIVMPGMNGFDLADEVKRLRQDMCVIYVSGYARDLLPHRDRLHGTFMVKPWLIEQLEAAISDCLSR